MSRAPQKKVSKLVATSGVRVKRYFPGKAPDIGLDDLSASENENESENEIESDAVTADRASLSTSGAPDQRGAAIAASPPRIHGPSGSDGSESESDEDSKRLLAARLRARQRAEEEATSSESDSESDAERTEPQMASQQRISKRDALPAVSLPSTSSDVQDSASSESSSESDSSSSDDDEDDEETGPAPRLLFKPTFVPRSQRQTKQDTDCPIDAPRNDKADGTADNIDPDSKRHEQRERSVQMAAEEARRARAQPEVDEDEAELVDDTDGVDPEAEFEAWKLRELLRIKRDKEEKEAADLEEEENERIRGMTEEQRHAEGLARARAGREAKAEQIREMNSQAREQQASSSQSAADSGDLVTQRMYEYAKIKAGAHHNHTKWKGYKKEDTSLGEASLWSQSQRQRLAQRKPPHRPSDRPR